DNQTTTGAHDAHGHPCGRCARLQGARMALWLTLAILVGAIYLFVTERLRVDVVALLVMTALVVTGVLTVPEGLSGFSSQATIMVAAMFVLSASLPRNGAVAAIGEVLSRSRSQWRFLLVMLVLGPCAAEFGDNTESVAVVRPPVLAGGAENRVAAIAEVLSRIRSQWLFLLVMLVLVSCVAAFVNNTATVAVFLPLVLAASTATRWAPSKFLIPLSYMSQAAGVCTLIGTSTNLLVDAMARDAAGVGFTLFEFAPLGIVFVGICMLYLMTVGRWLLPDRGVPGSEEHEHVGRYVAELLVPDESGAIGLRRSQVVPENIEY